jgi:hypothetical protein
MNVWRKRAGICLLLFIAGSVAGFASGAIGICGNGGWGMIPAVIGLLALPGSFVCAILGSVQNRRKGESDSFFRNAAIVRYFKNS